ncbi:uncharacterized protein Nmag_0475 [Natrialba magadii ATCC 43099]|uniref:Uncharacterized protein n=1 Tax=Natrialba magadii (strain ATCC 43099 / DSM 3394 / CCM 3739 / CIP 104546 / IAM 13178 / JCM 8861 / NBRC 102185 / NCIMB 2190 / MS3) TaxID=547559 RepID=D3SY23_NATMM|nr:hypothetical protein [Natrialba magadii]ADD04063.1 uncharacterized protein Nmag_0475 [Natrialba magadii ATCC 43099]ELY33220.1 hypothetical protein C500_02789 [Natrialba magadii ATCC 43099]
MNTRGRLFVGLLWLGVAGLMATTILVEPGFSASVSELVRLFVVALALFLAVVYLFDPWGVLSRQPFH